MEGRYELFYGTGGHRGPYVGLTAACDAAEALLKGDRSERYISVRPYSIDAVGGYGIAVATVRKTSDGETIRWAEF